MRDKLYGYIAKNARSAYSQEEADGLVRAAAWLYGMAVKAATEGLLSMEEYLDEAEIPEDPILGDLKYLAFLVVDGTDPELVWEYGVNYLFLSCPRGIQVLKAHMITEGILSIQRGENLDTIQERLLRILPEELSGRITREVFEPMKNRLNAKKPERMSLEQYIAECDRVDRLLEKDADISEKKNEYFDIVEGMRRYRVYRMITEADRSGMPEYEKYLELRLSGLEHLYLDFRDIERETYLEPAGYETGDIYDALNEIEQSMEGRRWDDIY